MVIKYEGMLFMLYINPYRLIYSLDIDLEHYALINDFFAGLQIEKFSNFSFFFHGIMKAYLN